MMEFKDKTAVVTGAAGVFGRWISEAFWREGARVVLADTRAEEARAIVEANGIGKDRALVQPVDLTREESILAMGEAVRSCWGAPDILVNNAGVYPKSGLLDLPAAEWDRIMGVNLRAPFLVTRMFARDMIAVGKAGAVVMISSGAARQMRNGSVPYCTSKTAIERLAKGFALELAPHRIRVNVVEPGFAPGSVGSPLPEDYVTRMNARIPLGRSSGPEDAPGAILYLCSARAGFITGATLSVDGGNSIGTYEPGELGKTR
jgi:3-oxoacyl-[acyl-carrier protein] reductase